MSNAVELPFNLFKANLALEAQLTRLMQENGQQWLDFSHQLVNDGVSADHAEAEKLLKAGNWQKLATLPMESFWRQWQQHVGDNQATVQTAVNAQTAFVKGLQDALRTWQQDTAEALGGAPFTRPFGDAAWVDLFNPWQQWLSGTGKSTSRGSK